MNSSGTLSGAGTLRISGTLTWAKESTMSGSGKTVLLSGATATTTLAGSAKLQRDFVNEGTFTTSKGSITQSEGAEFVNSGTFNANTGAENALSSGAGGSSFLNTGTFRKTSGASTFSVAIPFENKGAVSAQIGTLSFTGGGSSNESSKWEAVESGTVNFAAGSYTLSGVLAGPIVMSGGSVAIEALDCSAAKLDLSISLSLPSGTTSLTALTMKSGAGITGAGTLKISETLTWAKESTMSGSGKTVLLSGATATTTLAGSAKLQRDFVNEGTFTTSKGSITQSEGAEFVNSGTFNANTGAENALSSGAGGSSFLNTGTFRKTSGASTFSVAIPFENKGAVSAQIGTLSFTGGGSSNESSKWEAVESGTVNFAAGSYTLSGVLAGPIVMSGGSVAIEALDCSAAKLDLSISLSLPSGTTSLTALTMKSGAGITGAGTLKISETLTWAKESTMSGSGKTVLLSGATATTTLAGSAKLQRDFVNEGTFTEVSGTVELLEAAEFVNVGTFNADTSDPDSLAGDGSSTFLNSGVFQKTSGTNGASIAPFYRKRRNSRCADRHPHLRLRWHLNVHSNLERI